MVASVTGEALAGAGSAAVPTARREVAHQFSLNDVQVMKLASQYLDLKSKCPFSATCKAGRIGVVEPKQEAEKKAIDKIRYMTRQPLFPEGLDKAVGVGGRFGQMYFKHTIDILNFFNEIGVGSRVMSDDQDERIALLKMCAKLDPRPFKARIELDLGKTAVSVATGLVPYGYNEDSLYLPEMAATLVDLDTSGVIHTGLEEKVSLTRWTIKDRYSRVDGFKLKYPERICERFFKALKHPERVAFPLELFLSYFPLIMDAESMAKEENQWVKTLLQTDGARKKLDGIFDTLLYMDTQYHEVYGSFQRVIYPLNMALYPVAKELGLLDKWKHIDVARLLKSFLYKGHRFSEGVGDPELLRQVLLDAETLDFTGVTDKQMTALMPWLPPKHQESAAKRLSELEALKASNSVGCGRGVGS